MSHGNEIKNFKTPNPFLETVPLNDFTSCQEKDLSQREQFLPSTIFFIVKNTKYK
jgi:hypothetical protein